MLISDFACIAGRFCPVSCALHTQSNTISLHEPADSGEFVCHLNGSLWNWTAKEDMSLE